MEVAKVRVEPQAAQKVEAQALEGDLSRQQDRRGSLKPRALLAARLAVLR